MLDARRINFKNEKALKEALNQWEGFSLIEQAHDLKSCLSLRNAVRSLEKTIASELLKSKDNPEKWLELYKVHMSLEQKIIELGGKPSEQTKEQILFDTILFIVIRGVMHEQLDIDPEEDGIHLTEILDSKDTPADFYDEEVEKDEDFDTALSDASSKDIQKVHARLAHILTCYNNAYTMRQADYKLETVKVQTMGFLGKTLFPMLGNSIKWTKSKVPCNKGFGDWIDTPTTFNLARTNDLLQEAKGRLSVYAEEKKEQEEKHLRREEFLKKLKRFFHLG